MPTSAAESAPKAWLRAVRCGHGGHLHHAEGDADDGADDQGDDDPLVLDDLRVEQRGADGQRHADFAGEDAAARRGGRAQPLERENEENDGDDVGAVDEL